MADIRAGDEIFSTVVANCLRSGDPGAPGRP
jgi:hypothetical protein